MLLPHCENTLQQNVKLFVTFYCPVQVGMSVLLKFADFPNCCQVRYISRSTPVPLKLAKLKFVRALSSTPARYACIPLRPEKVTSQTPSVRLEGEKRWEEKNEGQECQVSRNREGGGDELALWMRWCHPLSSSSPLPFFAIRALSFLRDGTTENVRIIAFNTFLRMARALEVRWPIFESFEEGVWNPFSLAILSRKTSDASRPVWKLKIAFLNRPVFPAREHRSCEHTSHPEPWRKNEKYFFEKDATGQPAMSPI